LAADRLDSAHDLMTRHHGDGRMRKVAIDYVQVGATHTTRQNLDEHIGWPGCGYGGLDLVQVAETEPGQGHGLHRIL
jgi:hypothetical protein